jgi:hypothetical protein
MLLLSFALLPGIPVALNAAATPAALQKAKQDAEAKGFIFETSHDEIVAKARKEGKLRVVTSLEMESLKPVSGRLQEKISIH